MGTRPGTVAILSSGDVQGARLSTHALPLTVLIAYLEETMGVPATLVGIQPDLEAKGPSLTAAEQAAVARVVCAFQRLLGPRLARPRRRGGKGR
jgi:Ni,Fe-hydrogenase maturation factor